MRELTSLDAQQTNHTHREISMANYTGLNRTQLTKANADILESVNRELKQNWFFEDGAILKKVSGGSGKSFVTPAYQGLSAFELHLFLKGVETSLTAIR